MRKIFILAWLLGLTLPALAQEAGVGDSYYPQLGNSGYDVQHYFIDLKVDVENNQISGTTAITAIATHDLPTFNLDFSGLEISEIIINDTQANFERDASELIITPPTILERGDLFTVTVAYAGQPTPVDDPGVPFTKVGWEQYPTGIFVASEPSGAMNWFPSNNHPLDKATFSFHITVDEPYVTAANGLLQDEIENGDGTITTIWEASDPMATYLAAVYISEFSVETQEGYDGLPIRNYFPLESSASVRRVFEPTNDMLAYFSELIAPYPFEAYGVVVLDSGSFPGALENQTLSIFGRQALSEQVVAHELIHQWFGNSVSLADWSDIWLTEGMATYFEGLWIEHSTSQRAFNRFIDSIDTFMHQAKLPPPGDPGLANIFSNSVYVRGAMTYHALRLEVGDEVFFSILRAFYQRFAGGNATTEDFVTVAEEISGIDLQDFFNAWLYEDAVPELPE